LREQCLPAEALSRALAGYFFKRLFGENYFLLCLEAYSIGKFAGKTNKKE